MKALVNGPMGVASQDAAQWVQVELALPCTNVASLSPYSHFGKSRVHGLDVHLYCVKSILWCGSELQNSFMLRKLLCSFTLNNQNLSVSKQKSSCIMVGILECYPTHWNIVCDHQHNAYKQLVTTWGTMFTNSLYCYVKNMNPKWYIEPIFA